MYANCGESYAPITVPKCYIMITSFNASHARNIAADALCFAPMTSNDMPSLHGQPEKWLTLCSTTLSRDVLLQLHQFM